MQVFEKSRDAFFLAKYKQTLEQALTPNYQAILDAYFARRTGAANVAAAKPVLAPAELLDDEPDETEQLDHIRVEEIFSFGNL